MTSDGERRLGKYLLKSPLGKGGMGIVYRASDTRLQRDVAIKLLPKRLTSDAEAVKRFLREARVAARLSHPNVVSIFDVDFQQGYCFLVMELVNGGNAFDLIRKGPVPWREATRIVADACQGLAAAHDAQLIHRDIKPSNLMRTSDGLVKLADFGLAKALDEVASSGGHLTRSGAVLGTPQYMSPEQCRGEPLDGRSDIYSLGATYFALLTGRPPFADEQPLQVMFAHCSKPVADVAELVRDVPAACSDVVRIAMAKSPGERYPDARAFQAALRTLLIDGPTEARSAAPSTARLPPLAAASLPLAGRSTPDLLGLDDPDFSVDGQAPKGPSADVSTPAASGGQARPSIVQAVALANRPRRSGGLWRQAARRPLVSAVVGAGALLLFAAVGVGLWNGRSSDAPAPNGAGSSPAAPAAPDDVPTDDSSRTPPTVRLVQAFELPSQRSEVRGLAYSADGRRLYSGALDGRVIAWNLASRQLERELSGTNLGVRAVAANARWIAAGGDAQTLWLWDPATGELRQTLEKLGSEVASLAFSPDGRRLAVGLYSDLLLYDVEGDQARLIRRFGADARPPVVVYMTLGVAFSSDSRLLAATTFNDKAISVWNVADQELVERRTNVDGELSSVAFLPDNRSVIGGSLHQGLVRWSRPDGRIDWPAAARKLQVHSVVVLPDGRHAVTAGEWGGRIRLSNLAPDGANELFNNTNLPAALILAVSPDGRQIAVGGGSHQSGIGYVQLWDVKPR